MDIELSDLFEHSQFSEEKNLNQSSKTLQNISHWANNSAQYHKYLKLFEIPLSKGEFSNDVSGKHCSL